MVYGFFVVRKIVAHIVTFVFFCLVLPTTVLIPEVHVPRWGAIYMPFLITLHNAIFTFRYLSLPNVYVIYNVHMYVCMHVHIYLSSLHVCVFIGILFMDSHLFNITPQLSLLMEECSPNMRYLKHHTEYSYYYFPTLNTIGNIWLLKTSIDLFLSIFHLYQWFYMTQSLFSSI